MSPDRHQKTHMAGDLAISFDAETQTSVQPHASPAQKQYGDTRQTEDRELRVSGRNDEHNSAGLWLDGVFYDSDSSEHAEDGEAAAEAAAP